MVKLINQGDSIEGEKVLINTRKQIVQSPVEKSGIRFKKYKCSINSSAIITEELNPKRWLIKKTSALNKGDFVEADVIEVFTSDTLRFDKEANYSSTHGIQTAEAKSFTFAEIFKPFRFLVERLLPVQ